MLCHSALNSAANDIDIDMKSARVKLKDDVAAFVTK
jgi:hypothetical protein